MRAPVVALIVALVCAVSARAQQSDPFQSFFAPRAEDKQRIEQVEIGVRQEQQIGSQQVAAFKQRLGGMNIPLLSKGQDHEYVRALVDALHPLMTHAKRYRRIEVIVADSDETDARAFPGGHVVVSTGLLKFVPSEAALVGVLAHELAHIDHGHQLEQIRSMLAAQQTFQSGRFSFQDFMAGGRLMMNAVARPFRPEQETVADRDAVRWMMHLGYQPAEFARLFQKLARRDGRQDKHIPVFLRSHPLHTDRLKAVSETAAELAAQAKIDLGQLRVGKKNLRDRRPAVQR